MELRPWISWRITLNVITKFGEGRSGISSGIKNADCSFVLVSAVFVNTVGYLSDFVFV
jgi:hypothetical protein